MPDYKSLFYKSQTEIADTIEKLEALSLKLIKCMQYCEDKVTGVDELDEENDESKED